MAKINNTENPLYQNIKRLRKEKGISQAELANMVGYADKTMISHIENGKIDLTRSKIVEIANALNVAPGYLMGWNVPKENEFENLKIDYEHLLSPSQNELLKLLDNRPDIEEFIDYAKDASTEDVQVATIMLKRLMDKNGNIDTKTIIS